MAKAKETTQAVDSHALSNGNSPKGKSILSHSNVSDQTQISAASQSKTEANVTLWVKSTQKQCKEEKGKWEQLGSL